jgi:hypothetical protein
VLICVRAALLRIQKKIIAKFACGARAFLARVLLNSLFGRTGLNIYQSKYSIVSPDEGLKLKTNILIYTVFVGRYISFP